MKPSRFILSAVFASLLPLVTVAQTSRGTARDTITFRAPLNEARTLARSNNIDQTETALVALNRTKANTDAWYRETARRLIQMAGDMAKESRPQVAQQLTSRALARLDTAATLARTPQARAQAHCSAAFIHERHRGDLTAAMASYRAALQTLPTHRQAVEALERLQLTETHRSSKGRTVAR